MYPCGAPRPNASSVNFTAGETIPNAILATIGDGDAVCIYNLVDVHLVVDILGALNEPTSYEPLTPARLLETRSDVPQPGTVEAQFNGIGKPPAAGIVEFQVGGRGGVPGSARAAVLNVTATNTDGPGYFTVYPCGTRPTASNLNYVAGQTIPNAVITPLRADGRVCIYTHAGADIIVDVSGYFPTLQPG